MYDAFESLGIELARIGRSCRSFIKIMFYNRVDNFGRKEVLLQSDHKVFCIFMETVPCVVYFILFTKVFTIQTLYEYGEKLKKFVRSPV